MDVDKIIHLAADAGRIILENGGETYRVEETITRFCAAYGLKNAESFVTPTGIMISATYNYGQTISLVKRIKSRTVNLEKVSRINDLSRNLKSRGLSLEEVKTELARIEKVAPYKPRTTVLFCALGAGFFTLLFGGSFRDFLVALFIGAIIKICGMALSNIAINDFFINVTCGAITSFLALLGFYLHLVDNLDKVIIGSIMLLVPGLAITNAIRDTIYGDFLAGISRAIEAFLIAVAIAVGTGGILKLCAVWVGGINL